RWFWSRFVDRLSSLPAGIGQAHQPSDGMPHTRSTREAQSRFPERSFGCNSRSTFILILTAHAHPCVTQQAHHVTAHANVKQFVLTCDGKSACCPNVRPRDIAVARRWKSIIYGTKLYINPQWSQSN